MWSYVHISKKKHFEALSGPPHMGNVKHHIVCWFVTTGLWLKAMEKGEKMEKIFCHLYRGVGSVYPCTGLPMLLILLFAAQVMKCCLCTNGEIFFSTLLLHFCSHTRGSSPGHFWEVCAGWAFRNSPGTFEAGQHLHLQSNCSAGLQHLSRICRYLLPV